MLSVPSGSGWLWTTWLSCPFSKFHCNPSKATPSHPSWAQAPYSLACPGSLLQSTEADTRESSWWSIKISLLFSWFQLIFSNRNCGHLVNRERECLISGLTEMSQAREMTCVPQKHTCVWFLLLLFCYRYIYLVFSKTRAFTPKMHLIILKSSCFH